MSIYVQRDIPVPLERIWELTQNPDLHQRWDLRFSHIRYLPRQNPTDPQAFEYQTRLGLGITIRGTGTRLGEHHASGARTSSLLFGSADPRSLIRQGSGYWQYVPTGTGTRFITSYDYQVRWGRLGWCLDRALFRPLMAWATAWSFDRLARWAVQGEPPEHAARSTFAYWVARITLAAVWIYQGLVPKVLGPHPMEVQMCGPWFSKAFETSAVWWGGWAEMLFGLFILARPCSRWPAILTVILMPLAFLTAALNGTDVVGSPFNVTSVNTMVLALAFIVLILHGGVVSARNCQWKTFRRTGGKGRLSSLWRLA